MLSRYDAFNIAELKLLREALAMLKSSARQDRLHKEVEAAIEGRPYSHLERQNIEREDAQASPML